MMFLHASHLNVALPLLTGQRSATWRESFADFLIPPFEPWHRFRTSPCRWLLRAEKKTAVVTETAWKRRERPVNFDLLSAVKCRSKRCSTGVYQVQVCDEHRKPSVCHYRAAMLLGNWRWVYSSSHLITPLQRCSILFNASFLFYTRCLCSNLLTVLYVPPSCCYTVMLVKDYADYRLYDATLN